MKASSAVAVVLMFLFILAAVVAFLSQRQYVREHRAVHQIFNMASDTTAARQQAERLKLNPERYYKLAGYSSWLSLALGLISAILAVKTKRVAFYLCASACILISLACLLFASIRV